MSIALAEQLKKDLTDRYVVVAEGVPELRRFQGLTGTVKTVNMNGRALVQFDGAVDISWYDIDPAYLHVVDAPLKKEKPEAHAAPAAPAAKPAGQSPLDAIRAKAAGGAAAPAPAAAGEKKASPLDQIRAGAAKPAAAPAAGGSPLDKIRAAQAAKTADAPAASAPEAAAPAAEAPAPVEAPPVAAAPASPAAGPQPKSTADILAAIRKKS